MRLRTVSVALVGVVMMAAGIVSGVTTANGSSITIRENSFQSDCPVIRAERPFRLEVVVEPDVPTGTDAPAEYDLQLRVPQGTDVGYPEDGNRVETADGILHRWEILCHEPGQATFAMELFVGGNVVQRIEISQAVLPALAVERMDYIPEPQPVETKMLIGAHLCPLWETDRAELWNQVVKKHQERTPALGIYSQDQPEIADWETKWAREHGISFFICCWYRTSQGGPVTTMFEQSYFDDALFQSRFGDQMKFAIMWENQRRGVAGIDDERDLFENLMPYWIEKFFRRDNYLKINNCPVLFIYQPNDISLDLGGDDQARAAFDGMRQASREAGFDGLYLLGEYRGTDPVVLRRFHDLGLDYVFTYCWPVGGSPGPDQVIETQMRYIEEMRKHRDILPQIVTLSQAWSGWRDEGSIWKLPPADFERLLRRGKEWIESNIPANDPLGRMVILDNWNEWSEGHYIAPYREYGFGYLDAVRRVFSDAPEEHVDLLPSDIGLGPYDMPASHFENRTSWNFCGTDYDNWKRQFSPAQDWRAMMGVRNYANVGECLMFTTTTGDPAIGVAQDRTRAAAFGKLMVRMKTSVSKPDMLEFFWKTESMPEFSANCSVSATVPVSDDFVDYEIPLTRLSGWEGRVTELRIDPVMTPDTMIQIEHIRLAK